MRRASVFVFAFAVIFVSTELLQAEPPEARVSFSRDVRPILSNRCFKCHGFDPETREAGLRLDTREGLFSEHNGLLPITPGDPNNSEVLARILSHDDDVRMPPPFAKKDLTEQEKTILQKWVEQGADWQPHWAFIPPQRSEVPPVTKWSDHVIDRFIERKLTSIGFSPSAEADRYTLLRRVSLDLTGLPPTPEEADEFARDTSPDAYEKRVDQLLASDAYGERWARRWLDLARYADTNGYEKDRNRTIWPYRDWVINALNQNMPFDEFTVKQIAGDLLPNATESDRIATGFHRNTMLNEEGGIDPLEFRFYAMTDRVATTGTTWLGLTTGCAQCHDHKYDPISHREYFGMMACLDNADEVELPLQSAPDEAAEQAKAARLNELIRQLPSQWPTPEQAGEPAPVAAELAEAAFQQWYQRERQRAAKWTIIEPTKMSSNLPLLTLEEDGVIFVTGDTTKEDQYVIQARSDLKQVTAIRIEALPDNRLPGGGPGMTYYEGTKGDFFLTEISLQNAGIPVAFQGASESYAKNGFGANPATAMMAIDGDRQTGWSVVGRQGERLTAVFKLATPVDLTHVELKLIFGRHFASSLGKFRISATSAADPVALDVSEEVDQLLCQDAVTEDEQEKIRQGFYLQAPELAKHASEIRKLMSPAPSLTTLVFQERPEQNPRPTFLRHRGEFLQPKEQIPPLTLSFLNPIPEGVPLNRLTFAQWLVARDHPLTARVFVNRQWGAFFGTGLVATVQDFGFQGATPSHPDLLDWLAVEFMESGWDMKALHRLIVTSRTYRQSSVVTPELLEKDPSNHFLTRGPRMRMEAEVIRDSALVASGLMTHQLGGPPVYPPQPEGVTEAAYGNPKWHASAGNDRYRRSVYTFIKRTAPFAMYSTFDAPSGEACLAKRDVSNTAIQGLTLLNDPMFVEAARGLAQRAVATPGDDRAKAERIFRLVVTRPVETDELDQLTTFVQAQKTYFAENGNLAESLAGVQGDEATELAAWVALSRAILSLDEAITRN
ncbi:PSD1 and planctomycete cytochrome C domain-containing protein [Planctomicrobium sp. SH668]|uniref:PSD1 and planctomycete cytochrome C domain-containing protein n=1 Tax=Planctomicrobium sp. SH668 TaxID=3448126 RepID=UPI003F5C580C